MRYTDSPGYTIIVLVMSKLLLVCNSETFTNFQSLQINLLPGFILKLSLKILPIFQCSFLQSARHLFNCSFCDEILVNFSLNVGRSVMKYNPN